MIETLFTILFYHSADITPQKVGKSKNMKMSYLVFYTIYFLIVIFGAWGEAWDRDIVCAASVRTKPCKIYSSKSFHTDYLTKIIFIRTKILAKYIRIAQKTFYTDYRTRFLATEGFLGCLLFIHSSKHQSLMEKEV